MTPAFGQSINTKVTVLYFTKRYLSKGMCHIIGKRLCHVSIKLDIIMDLIPPKDYWMVIKCHHDNF